MGNSGFTDVPQTAKSPKLDADTRVSIGHPHMQLNSLNGQKPVKCLYKVEAGRGGEPKALRLHPHPLTTRANIK